MPQNDIVDRFCTPPAGADAGALSGADSFEIPFEGERLAAYAWGAGPNVLLIHGWGSRAGHLALLARILAKAGYRVTAYDGPAHGRSLKTRSPNRSSLFEQCRALSCVAGALGPIRAVVGHSLGAAAAAFTLAGHGIMSGLSFAADALVMLSCPSGISRMIERFCAASGEEDRAAELTDKLQRAFDFDVDQYRVADALPKVTARVLVVHDEADEEIPAEDARGMKTARPDAALVFTKGSGHQKILVSRDMFRAVTEFLSS